MVPVLPVFLDKGWVLIRESQYYLSRWSLIINDSPFSKKKSPRGTKSVCTNEESVGFDLCIIFMYGSMDQVLLPKFCKWMIYRTTEGGLFFVWIFILSTKFKNVYSCCVSDWIIHIMSPRIHKSFLFLKKERFRSLWLC